MKPCFAISCATALTLTVTASAAFHGGNNTGDRFSSSVRRCRACRMPCGRQSAPMGGSWHSCRTHDCCLPIRTSSRTSTCLTACRKR